MRALQHPAQPHQPPLQAQVFDHAAGQAGTLPLIGIGRREQIDRPTPALQSADNLVDMGIGCLPLAGGFQGQVEKVAGRAHASVSR